MKINYITLLFIVFAIPLLGITLIYQGLDEPDKALVDAVAVLIPHHRGNGTMFGLDRYLVPWWHPLLA